MSKNSDAVGGMMKADEALDHAEETVQGLDDALNEIE